MHARRSDPARTGPNRRATPPAGAGDPGLSSAGRPGFVGALDEGFAAARRFVEGADFGVRGAVERGVETAYLVIDEYMRRGREAAGRYYERTTGSNGTGGTNGSDAMNDRTKFDADWTRTMAQVPPFLAPWMLAQRMWMDAFASWIPAGQALSRAWLYPMMPGGSFWPWMPSPSRISYQVQSSQPAEVSATVDFVAPQDRLSVGDLKPTGEGAAGPAIRSVGIALASAGHVRITVNVPPGQAAGTYVGEIHDDRGNKRGTVTVVVGAAREGAGKPSGRGGGRGRGRKAAPK
jgi:hypothetical protein